MPSELLENLMQQIGSLSVEEQIKLRDAINRLLSEEVDRRLMARGLVSRIPGPLSEEDMEAHRNYKPITAQGKPVSETLIEERR